MDITLSGLEIDGKSYTKIVRQGKTTIIENNCSKEVNLDDLKPKLNNLRESLNFINNLNEKLQPQFIEQLKEKYKRLWEKLGCVKDTDPYLKQTYYEFFNVFTEPNFSPLVSFDFDKNILPSGWIKGQVYTISSVSGGGKTSLAIMMCAVLMLGCNPLYKDCQKQNPAKVLYINLEQSNEEIEKRLISCLSGLNDLDHAVSYSDLMNAKSIKNVVNYNISVKLFSALLNNLKILNCSDFRTLDIEDIKDKIYTVIEENSYDFVIIDQFQNIFESDIISEKIPTSLRDMARELNIPVLVLAQMNKSSQRDNRKKDGSINVDYISGDSLKGTNALEQQSTIITFLIPTGVKSNYRGYECDEYYIFNSKSRYGSNGKIKLFFLKQFNLFVEVKNDDKNNKFMEETSYVDENL